jgi:hypothetical protein
VKLPKTEERDFRAVLPASLAVPEFDGFDHASLSWQIDSARLAASRNAIANQKFFVRAVMKVHDDALEENFAAFDAQLDGAETAVVFADVNAVVIVGPVNMSVAEIVPTALRLGANGGECESEQKSDGSKSDSFEHFSSVCP